MAKAPKEPVDNQDSFLELFGVLLARLRKEQNELTQTGL